MIYKCDDGFKLNNNQSQVEHTCQLSNGAANWTGNPINPVCEGKYFTLIEVCLVMSFSREMVHIHAIHTFLNFTLILLLSA
jgi:hypothetical protein